MKKLVTLVGSAALFAAAIIPAIAASNDCSNSTTGPFSNNTCSITNTDNISVNNVNDARIYNDVYAKSNTGGNSASYNTLGGSIVTGDSTANVTVSNVANINTTNITAALAAAAQNSGSNSLTGPVSNNVARISNSFTADVYNSNQADVKNEVEVKSNTGYNDADYNTGPASITTGDAWLGLLVNNHLNDSLTAIRGGAGGSGSNTAENSTTGPFSNNTVDISNDHSATVNNVNDLRIKNDVYAKANSGYNDANKNALGGDIFTGGAAAGVGVDSQGNINSTLIAMALGGFDNTGVNSVTGPAEGNEKDPNEIIITNSRNVVVDNWNNKCQNEDAHEDWWWNPWRHEKVECDTGLLGVYNDVEVKSDTGKNDSDFNTGGGNVLAGFADLLQQVLVHVNDNLTEIL